ncbi:hypothetical protein C9374_002681 [Naegleria lovaniensis]|uniref:Guanine nucleotide-binding protein subunit beta-like protein n=1 Tax=Naegleria lovaniensis TaxID=51637 RepID=A0AA88GSU7_NAELO|nr:uncharacterized protein C9374_002681 [Naegleria lovaniensis]KAG2386235.1 hypothetical protein C9374_002681 [Naegleria lovaniensis]
MSENYSLTSQNSDKSSTSKMVDDDESIIEKIDYYANKVNVFFAMQPAIETLSKLVTERKNVIKMIQEAETKRKEQQAIEQSIQQQLQVTKPSLEIASDPMDTFDIGGWDDVFECTTSQNKDFNHHKPSVVEVDHDTTMMTNHSTTTSITNPNNTTKKPTVTIKKKTNTNHSAKTNTSSSSTSSPVQPPSPSMSASSSSDSDHMSSVKQGKRKKLRTTKSKSASEHSKEGSKNVDPLFENMPSSDDDEEVPTQNASMELDAIPEQSTNAILESAFKHVRGKFVKPPHYFYYPSEDKNEQRKQILYPSTLVKNSSIQNVETAYRQTDNLCYQGIPFLPAQSLYCPKKASPDNSTSSSNILLDSDSELCVLQIARIDATIPEFRIQRYLRYVVKDDIEEFENEYQFHLTLRRNNEGEDIPFSSYYKPYLKRKKCDKLLEMSSKELKDLGLLHGDLIHCPFTPAEVKVIKYLKTKKWSSKKISILLENRCTNDVKNYLEDMESNEGQHGEALTYYENPMPIVAEKTISELMASRGKQVGNISLNNLEKLSKMDRTFPSHTLFTLNFHYRQAWLNAEVTRSHSPPFSGPIVEIAFSKTGEKVAAVSTNGEPNAYMFDLKHGKRYPLSGHLDTVTDVKFTSDNSIVTSSFDKAIRVFNASDGRLERIIKKTETTDGHEDEVSLLAIHPEEEHLVASCSEKEKSLRIWDIRNGNMVADLMSREKERNEISGIEFSKDNTLYAMSIHSLNDKKCGDLLTYDLVTFQNITKLVQGTMEMKHLHFLIAVIRHNLEFIHKQGATRCAWSHQRGTWLLATCGDNYATHLYSISSGDPLLRSFEEKKNPLAVVAMSPDDQTICSGDDGGIVYMFSTNQYDISRQ